MEILNAEDDRVTALKLQRALEKTGYSVKVARDGAEAWNIVSDGNVRILVSDWMMPKIDGPELCRRIRARPDSSYTYVILLTARDSRDDRIEGLEAGADDFLSKPVDTSELLARLNVAQRILTMQEQLKTHAAEIAKVYAALERQNVLLAERAATDALTSLGNRRVFDESIVPAVSFAARHNQPLSLVMLDVDHFKSYNDNFGHPCGDDILREIATVLKSGCRVHDMVARYGGEEFALILPATGVCASIAVCERLRQTINSRRWPNRPVTASLGVATTRFPAQNHTRLIWEADKALYHSKSRGRNRVTHFTDMIFHNDANEKSDDLIPIAAESQTAT